MESNSTLRHELVPFPESRLAVVDYVTEGRRKNHIPALLELDVTKALDMNRQIKKVKGESLSFTGWIAKCIGQAVVEHKSAHAMRKGARHLVIFDDVDISIPVEQTLKGVDGPTKTFPMPYLIRAVNRKSVREIHNEIRASQSRPVDDRNVYAQTHSGLVHRIIMSLPSSFRRRVFWRRRVNDPFYIKSVMGTVALTSVGMFGKGARGSAWGIPIGLHPLVVLLGGTARKPAFVDEKIVARDFLSVTILLDHDVIDGAPAARFLSRLTELIESGYGLQKELEISDEISQTVQQVT